MYPSDDEKENACRTSSLTMSDAVALLICWAGASAITYFSKEPAVAVIAIAAAYYLAKWIILKKESD